jgi:hypothetical protein
MPINVPVRPMPALKNITNQLLAHGQWFSPGTPASSTTKTYRHDIAEILLKVALNTKIKSNQINLQCNYMYRYMNMYSEYIM